MLENKIIELSEVKIVKSEYQALVGISIYKVNHRTRGVSLFTVESYLTFNRVLSLQVFRTVFRKVMQLFVKCDLVKIIKMGILK